MFFLYSFLLTIGFLILRRVLFFRKNMRRVCGSDSENLPDFEQKVNPLLWLHCVSVGETNAARPLVKQIREKFPEYQLVVSNTTLTGQTLAKEIFAADAKLIFYFPFDWKFTVHRALNKIKPNVVLLMETEIWFNFVREAKKSGAKVVLVNGRLSEKSANRYALIRRTMQRVLHYFDLMLMQGQKDAKRMLGLGSRGTKISVTGNIKFDQEFDETESDLTKELRQAFCRFKRRAADRRGQHARAGRILDSRRFQESLEKFDAGKYCRVLMLVPRHPERFAEVANLIKATGFEWAKRSETASPKDKISGNYSARQHRRTAFAVCLWRKLFLSAAV